MSMVGTYKLNESVDRIEDCIFTRFDIYIDVSILQVKGKNIAV